MRIAMILWLGLITCCCGPSDEVLLWLLDQLLSVPLVITDLLLLLCLLACLFLSLWCSRLSNVCVGVAEWMRFEVWMEKWVWPLGWGYVLLLVHSPVDRHEYVVILSQLGVGIILLMSYLLWHAKCIIHLGLLFLYVQNLLGLSLVGLDQIDHSMSILIHLISFKICGLFS